MEAVGTDEDRAAHETAIKKNVAAFAPGPDYDLYGGLTYDEPPEFPEQPHPFELKDLLASSGSIKRAHRDNVSGAGSRTQGPLSIHVLEDGRNLIVDGYHRLAEHLAGGSQAPVYGKIIGRGYTNYHATPEPHDVADLVRSQMQKNAGEHDPDMATVQAQPGLSYPAAPEPPKKPGVVDAAMTGGLALDANGQITLPANKQLPRGKKLKLDFPTHDGNYMSILEPHSYDIGDDERELYHQSVHEPFERAMSHWLPLNRALADGRLPQSIMRKAVLFSAMSPNTGVPLQERHYGHLMDMINDGQLDLNRSITGKQVSEFVKRATGPEYPRWNRAHYEAHTPAPGNTVDDEMNEGDQKGDLPQVMGLSHMDEIHQHLSDLIAKHRDDTQTIAGTMMEMKAEHKRHQVKLSTDRIKGRDTEREAPNWPRVMGFGPKLTRYALAMLGGGNHIVPDRHMVRSLFNLPLMDPATHYLATQVVTKPTNEKLLRAIDEHFFNHHPAVQHVLNRYPDHFKGRERQAIFPAMWLHWLATPHYERNQGRLNMGFNGGTDHGVFWDSIRDTMRKHGIHSISDAAEHGGDTSFDPKTFKTEHPVALHGRALQALEEVRQRHGEVAASLAYHTHVVPALLANDHGAALLKMEIGIELLQKQVNDVTAPPRGPAVLPPPSRVIHFLGHPIIPGRARTSRGDYHLVFDAGTHYLALPPKGNDVVSLPKRKEGTHFQVVEPLRHISDKVLDSTVHGVSTYNTTPEQHSLIHGADVTQWAAEAPRHAVQGSEDGRWVRGGHGRMAYIKASEPEREAIFHNTARDFFGLGQHVPPTAVFDHPATGKRHSIQEMVGNAQHYNHKNPRHRQILKRLDASGDLDKLALMDGTMGVWDRNKHNYVLSKDSLHLIDNSSTFSQIQSPPDYWASNMAGPNWEYAPSYPGVQEKLNAELRKPLHSSAVEWISHLDAKKLEDHLHRQGAAPRIIKERGRRIRALQGLVLATDGKPTRGAAWQATRGTDRGQDGER